MVIIILTILLAIVLGLSTIFFGQLAMVHEMDYSLIAFYAADAGIEAILSYRNNPSSSPVATNCIKTSPCKLSNQAKYYLEIRDKAADSNCPSYCIKSFGTYKEISRAVEIAY
ncbi:MAG: hypothetical protein QME57_00915 [Patescibacteria group bacterium]|nr:hypothetical protein [Patescibacteria group bacterium]